MPLPRVARRDTMADERRPKHAFNGRLVVDGVMFVIVLAIAIGFYIAAFHPF